MEPPAGAMKRRITRRADGSLPEDLRKNAKTSERLLDRQLWQPDDLLIEVEIATVGEEPITWDDKPMELKEQSLYRAVVARVNFLSQDRAELLFASKECSRHMSQPCNGDWAALKRIGKFLKGCPRVVSLFEWQDAPTGVAAYTDSTWAGCRATRKSTSGAAFLHGRHLLKAYSRTQSNIALSSAEAELYATVAAASEGLGLKAMARDFGIGLDTFLHVDASAAIGIAQCKGLGKLRHLDTQALWIQGAVRSRRVSVEKVKGTENPADLMTKHLDGTELIEHLRRLGVHVQGLAEAAPELVKRNQGLDVESSNLEVDAVSEKTVESLDKMSLLECRPNVLQSGRTASSSPGARKRASSAPASGPRPRIRFAPPQICRQHLKS